MDSDLVLRLVRPLIFFVIFSALGVAAVLLAQRMHLAQTPQRSIVPNSALLAEEGVRLPADVKVDERASLADGRELWAILLITPEQARDIKEQVLTLDANALGSDTIDDNSFDLAAMKLPLGKAPGWWIDPRTIGADIIAHYRREGSHMRALYMGISYATGQVYLVRWTGPAKDWTYRPISPERLTAIATAR